MSDINKALVFVFKLEYNNNPDKALEQVQGEDFLTYKGLQERDDTDFAGWKKIHDALFAVLWRQSRKPETFGG